MLKLVFIKAARIVAPFVLVLGLQACGSSGSDSDGFVRYVHLSPDAGMVNIQAEEEEVIDRDNLYNIDNVSYLESTGYLATRDGLVKVEVRSSESGEKVIEAELLVEDGEYRTVYVADSADSLDLIVSDDDRDTPDSGFAWVRAIHGAASAPTVDIYVTGPGAPLGAPTLEDVDFRAVSDYLALTTGTYRIRVTPANSTNVVIDSGSVELVDGQVLTVVAVDAPGGGAPFGFLILDDRG